MEPFTPAVNIMRVVRQAIEGYKHQQVERLPYERIIPTLQAARSNSQSGQAYFGVPADWIDLSQDDIASWSVHCQAPFAAGLGYRDEPGSGSDPAVALVAAISAQPADSNEKTLEALVSAEFLHRREQATNRRVVQSTLVLVGGSRGRQIVFGVAGDDRRTVETFVVHPPGMWLVNAIAPHTLDRVLHSCLDTMLGTWVWRY